MENLRTLFCQSYCLLHCDPVLVNLQVFYKGIDKAWFWMWLPTLINASKSFMKGILTLLKVKSSLHMTSIWVNLKIASKPWTKSQMFKFPKKHSQLDARILDLSIFFINTLIIFFINTLIFFLIWVSGIICVHLD